MANHHVTSRTGGKIVAKRCSRQSRSITRHKLNNSVLIFLKVKSLVEEKSGKKFTLFRAYTYATQVVAGTNYFIKVRHTLRAWLQAHKN